jgi:hypothetical protein
VYSDSVRSRPPAIVNMIRSLSLLGCGSSPRGSSDSITTSRAAGRAASVNEEILVGQPTDEIDQFRPVLCTFVVGAGHVGGVTYQPRGIAELDRDEEHRGRQP